MIGLKLPLKTKNLNGSMANCASKYLEEYVPEDSLKEAILCQNPVPDNLDNVKKLDNFFKGHLQRKTQNKRTKYRKCSGKASA